MSDVQQLEAGDSPPAARRPRDSDKPGGPTWLELIIAIALGLAAIVGAFATYRNEQENHHASAHFSEGITNFDDSGQLFSTANLTRTRDQSQFLSYVTAQHDRKHELANFILQHVMDARLQAAVRWWQSPANTRQPQPAETPFTDRNPNYMVPELVQAGERTAASKRLFEEAKAEQGNADHFQLIEVILATALFLYGIAGVTRSMTVKLVTLGTGGVIFVVSVSLLIFG